MQGNFAVDANGKFVDPSSEQAVRWDLSGAIIRVHQSTGISILKIYDMLRGEAKQKLINWNDVPERKHADVLALLDSTIAKL